MQCRAKQGSAVVGPAASKSGRDSIRSAADEPSHDGYLAILDKRQDQIASAFGNRIGLRFRRHEVVIGDENLARIQVLGRKTAQPEERGDQMRRKLLAYVDAANGGDLGPHGVYPQVTISVRTEVRRQQLLDLIERLPSNAWAIVTSARVEPALRHLAMAGLPVPNVLITAEQTPRGKPDPAGYRMAADRLAVAPGDCVAIEDSPAGIRAALDAGMTVIGVTTTHAVSELSHAAAVISKLHQEGRLIGVLFARRLTRPLGQIVRVAEPLVETQIARGEGGETELPGQLQLGVAEQGKGDLLARGEDQLRLGGLGGQADHRHAKSFERRLAVAKSTALGRAAERAGYLLPTRCRQVGCAGRARIHIKDQPWRRRREIDGCAGRRHQA